MRMSNKDFQRIVDERYAAGNSLIEAYNCAQLMHDLIAIEERCDDCAHDACQSCRGENTPTKRFETKSLEDDDPDDIKELAKSVDELVKDIKNQKENHKLMIAATKEMAEIVVKLKKRSDAGSKLHETLDLLHQKIKRHFGKQDLSLKHILQASQKAQERLSNAECQIRAGRCIRSEEEAGVGAISYGGSLVERLQAKYGPRRRKSFIDVDDGRGGYMDHSNIVIESDEGLKYWKPLPISNSKNNGRRPEEAVSPYAVR